MAKPRTDKLGVYRLIEGIVPYDPFYILGQVSFPVTIRGVVCSRCGPEFTMGVVPLECPQEMAREIMALPRKQIPASKLMPLIRKWRAEMARLGHNCQIDPGTSFLPCVWKVASGKDEGVKWKIDPTRIEYDLFEPPLSRFVSKRLFERLHGVSGATFHKVRIEPEMPGIAKSWYLLEAEEMPYGEKESSQPEPARCPECEYVLNTDDELERYDEEYRSYSKKHLSNLTLPRSNIPPLDIFWANMLGGLVVTDSVYQILKAFDLSACKIQTLTVVDE